MPLNNLHKQLKEKHIKFLFTDYYDTIVHRHVHPNYTQRIWAKHMIRELGLSISIDELYYIRQESVKYLVKALKKPIDEIPYNKLKEQVCLRLVNSNFVLKSAAKDFIALFEDADVRAESQVQYINQDVIDTLKYFKSNGGKIYLVSDFYSSKSLFEKLLAHHGILELFDGVYSSSELEKSKHSNKVYSHIISELSIDPSDVMMIGDNERSDYTNAIKNGLHAYHLPHKNYLKKNKLYNLGNDGKSLEYIVNKIYKNCLKGDSIPYTEYIIFYHVFTERLYETSKKKRIKDLYFLSREGLFLKKLFDSYQDFVNMDERKKIKTHYLQVSRHATLQISLKNLDDEKFDFLRKKYKNLSVSDFLIAVNCPKDLIIQIISELKIDGSSTIEAFFSSSEFDAVKQNEAFKSYYTTHRHASHNAFKAYLETFNTDIENDGINLVDIGWGGTMQEAIYKFLDNKIPVTGYYFGLSYNYNIQPDTQRYGLISSIIPYPDYYDHILMANKQLYEQFSNANHGSAVDYSLDKEGFVIEYHEPQEKWLYDHYIKAHQDAMFTIHKALLNALEPVCYTDALMQKTISKIALKVSLFQSTKKLKFIDTLNNGFYQNVGNNQVGLSYELPKIRKPLKNIIKFLITPEKHLRYIVKLKPVLYKKNKIAALLTPMYPIYFYFRINKFIRFKVLQSFFKLKYNVFK